MPPLRQLSRERDPAEVAAVDAGNPVVLGQPLVRIRVVGRQEIQHTRVVPDEALHEELGLLLECLAQVLIKLREDDRVRHDALEVPQDEPLPGEVPDEGARPGVCQHPPGLLFQYVRILEAAAFGECQELFVRKAAPQEKRQPGCQLQIAHGIDRTRRDVGGVAFHPEEEIG